MGTSRMQQVILLFICAVGFALSAGAQAGQSVLIRNVNLIDPATGKLEEHADINVIGGYVAEVGHGLKSLPGELTVDKSGKFVVPGLIDTRVQISISPGNRVTRAELGAEQRIAWMNSMVAVGVTTARFIQGDLSEHTAFRHFRELSLLNGPWIVASGPTFTALDGTPANQYSLVAIKMRERETHEVGNEDDAIRQSRDVAHNGGEIFEINYSSGPVWVAAPRLKEDLLAIITKEAHGHQLRAFCWVGTNEEAKSAIENGCDVLEGLSEEVVNDEVLKLMAVKQIAFVPSLVDQGYLATEKTDREALQAYLSQEIVQRTLTPLMKKSFGWDPNNQVGQLHAALDRLIPKPEHAPRLTIENKNGVLEMNAQPAEDPQPKPDASTKPDSTEPSKPNSPAQQPQSDDANLRLPTVGEALRSQEERARENVKRLNAAGIPIVVGTGAGNLLNIPGASEHLELQLLVEAGLTPLQALQAATRNAAAALGGSKEFGAVEKGKRADFLLLNANPLLDVKNISNIDTVVRGGWFVDSQNPNQY